VSLVGLALIGTGAFGGILVSCADRYRIRVTGAILYCNDLTSIATFEIDESPDSLSNVRSAMSYSVSRSVSVRRRSTRVRVRVCRRGSVQGKESSLNAYGQRSLV
jgi:hypothetical protein